MILHYTETGYLIILPRNNPHRIVDAMLETGYNEEFCVSLDFSPDFIARLMAAGFLVMSAKFDNAAEPQPSPPGEVSPIDEVLEVSEIIDEPPTSPAIISEPSSPALNKKQKKPRKSKKTQDE